MLRDYQSECIANCVEAFQSGKRRIGVSLATGGGKTVIFSHLLAEAKPLPGHGDKTLITVHREELVHQAYDRIKAIHPQLTVEIEMAKSHASGMADVTVASIQSIGRPSRITKFDPVDYKLLIIDEAHHAVSTQYLRLLKHFGANKPDSKVAVAGFSATLYRQDGKSLTKAMDELVFHRDLLDMIKSEWLCNVHITTVKLDVEMSRGVESKGEDFNPTALAQVLNTDKMNQLVVRTWSHQSNNAEKYKSTMVFCANIDHAVAVTNAFRAAGVDARCVTSQTSRTERHQNVTEFRQQQYPVLVNCGVFTEGTDIPNIDMIVINRPTKSPGLLSQMIGRGLRTHPGKSHCHVVDICGVVSDTDVVTAPALFRMDPGEVLQGADVIKHVEAEEEEQKAQREAKEKPTLEQINKVKLESFESLNDLVTNNQKLRPSAYSSLNWLPISDKCFILSGRGRYLRLEENRATGEFTLTSYHEIPMQFPKMYRKVGQFSGEMDPHQAVVRADKFVKESPTFPNNIVQKSAQWKLLAATKAQTESLTRNFKKLSPEILAELEQRGILDSERVKRFTKGQCSDLLSQFTLGGRVATAKWLIKQDKRRQQLKRVQQFELPNYLNSLKIEDT